VPLVCFFCEGFPDFPARFPVLDTANTMSAPIQIHRQQSRSIVTGLAAPVSASAEPGDQPAPKGADTIVPEAWWTMDEPLANFFREFE
jgi:hypothetical protein